MKLYETPQTKNAAYIKARPINPIGIFVHSTGASNATLKRYVDAPSLVGTNLYGNHWNKTTATKAVHAFIGLDANKEVAVCHCLPYNIACWGAGGGTNGSYNYNPQAHIQFEICEDNAPRSGKAPTQEQRDYYNAAFLAAEEYCAYLCKLLNLSPYSIVGHYEAAKRGYASNHSDPANWMSIFGDSMDNFRSRVAARLKNESEPPKEEPKPEQHPPILANDPIINVKLTKQENAYFFKKSIGDTISLPTEEYLLGVVPAEIGTELRDIKAYEAGKAQAIAARTVAYARTKGGRAISDDSGAHQSYRAQRSTNPAYENSHSAVNDTAGKVLFYNGKIADSTVYSHSNGGRVRSPKEAGWSGTQQYLVSKDDPYTKEPKNGHGVGMSQVGAIEMSKVGKSYEEILSFYYPSTSLTGKVDEPTLPDDTTFLAEVVTMKPASLNIWNNTKKNKSLKIVPKGAVVEVLQIVDKTWAKVRFEGVTGYSDRQYLKRQDEPSDVLYMAKVKTRFPLSLNIWQNPNKGKSLAKVPNKETVEVLDEYNYTWAKIRYKGTVGYSDRQYLEKV